MQFLIGYINVNQKWTQLFRSPVFDCAYRSHIDMAALSKPALSTEASSNQISPHYASTYAMNSCFEQDERDQLDRDVYGEPSENDGFGADDIFKYYEPTEPDDDHVGCETKKCTNPFFSPSDAASDRISHIAESSRKAFETQPLRTRISPQFSHITTDDDDTPLATLTTSNIHAAHERIIQHDREVQNKMALRILEGRASVRDAQVSVRRSGTMPAVQSRKSKASLDRLRAVAQDGSLPLTRHKTSLQRSTTAPKLRTDHDANAGITSSVARLHIQPDSLSVLPTGMSDSRVHARPNPFQSSGMAPPYETMATLRVFVLSMQRYTMVHMTEQTLALHLLQSIQAHIQLPPCSDPFQDWAVFDVLPDLGLERPLREYERISDVLAARANDKGYFIVKMAEWPSLLRADAVPHFSAVLGGFVSVLVEQRKWTRKWLELREHSLFLAKSENVCNKLRQLTLAG